MDIDTSAKNACDDYNPSRSEWTSLLTSMIRENNKSWQDKFDALNKQHEYEQRKMQVDLDGWKKSYYVLLEESKSHLETFNASFKKCSDMFMAFVADSKCKQQEDLDKVKERTTEISNSGNSDSMIAASTLEAENSSGSVLLTTVVEAEIAPNYSIFPSVQFSFQAPKAVSNHGSSGHHHLPSVDLPPLKKTALTPHKVPPDLVEQLHDVAHLLFPIIKPTQHVPGFHFCQRPIFVVPALRLLFYNNRFSYLWQQPRFHGPCFSAPSLQFFSRPMH